MSSPSWFLVCQSSLSRSLSLFSFFVCSWNLLLAKEDGGVEGLFHQHRFLSSVLAFLQSAPSLFRPPPVLLSLFLVLPPVFFFVFLLPLWSAALLLLRRCVDGADSPLLLLTGIDRHQRAWCREHCVHYCNMLFRPIRRSRGA